MMHRIKELNQEVKVFMLFGSRTRIDASISNDIKEIQPQQFDIYCVKNASHHVFADRPNEFNNIIIEICQKVETT